MAIRISERSVTRNTTDLMTDFYVRKHLDHDWAFRLAELIENGVEMEAIFITREDKVIDGRHRIEATGAAGKSEIKCKIVEADSDIELIAFALKCNLGGGLPANKGDIEHTIKELLNRGVPKKQLAELLTMLPAKLVRKYLNDVESQMHRVKLQKAAASVSSGENNVAKAATQYDVPESEVKALLGTRVSARTKRGMEENKRQLSSSYKSLGQRNGAMVRRVLDEYDDGDASYKQVKALFDHLDHLNKVSSKKIAEWRKRFEAREAPRKIA